MNEISPQQMIQWFRSKAAEFNGIADTLERTFTPLGTPSFKASDAPAKPEAGNNGPPPSDTVTASEIKDALMIQGYRVSGLAKHLNVTEEAINKVIAFPGNGLIIGERGWIKELIPQPPDVDLDDI